MPKEIMGRCLLFILFVKGSDVIIFFANKNVCKGPKLFFFTECIHKQVSMYWVYQHSDQYSLKLYSDVSAIMINA